MSISPSEEILAAEATGFSQCAGRGAVDHDRLAEFVESLDFDAKRYADIFEERTANAKTAVDVRGHLAGKAKLLDAAGAVDAGIATTISDAVVPAEAVRWWV